MSKLLDNVVGELSRLPGIGRRTALRLAMHILRMEEQDVVSMGESLIDFRTKICRCAKCNNLSDTEICDVCADATRDRSTVCVVEQVSDLLSIEKTHQYRGVYSVLGGVISPMQGIAPSDLRIDSIDSGSSHIRTRLCLSFGSFGYQQHSLHCNFCIQRSACVGCMVLSAIKGQTCSPRLFHCWL